MHLIILTQYYPPEIGAPQARLSELAQRLIQKGHQVTVLTAMPNYPLGQIFDGYKGLIYKEEIKGVKVLRTFLYPTQKADLVRRLINYMSFLLSSSIFGSFLLEKADYLLVESPPLFLGLGAYWLSKLKSARLIFNVSDLWPESAVELGVLDKHSIAYQLSARLEKFCYEHAWLVSGQSKSILQSILERFPKCQVFHLSNGVDTRNFHPDLVNQDIRNVFVEENSVLIVYAGLHGLAQGLDQIIYAASELKESDNIKFVFLGDGPEKKKLQLLATEKQATNIYFHEPRPHAEIPQILASADIILVPLKKYIPGAVPSKLYEAMASGRPVILLAEGEAARIVDENRCGIVITPGNIQSLVIALKNMASNPNFRNELGNNGRNATLTAYDRDQIVLNFISYLEANLDLLN